MENLKVKRNIKPFDGEKYSVWKFRLFSLLKELGVINVVKNAVPEKVTDEWRKAEDIAKSVIIEYLSDSFLGFAKEDTTAKEILNNLDKIYERKSLATQLSIRKKLLLLKLQGDISLIKHFTVFDDLITELLAAGGKLDETDKVSHLLLTLPTTYDGVITAIETLSEDNLTLAFVKTRLLDHEIKIKSDSADTSAKVLNVQTTEKQPPNNSKIQKNSFNGQKHKFKSNKKVFNVKCHQCGRKGHIKPNCIYYKRGLQYKTNKVNEKNKTAQNMQSSNLVSINPSTSSFAFLAGGERYETEENGITFILDSGATDHMINRKDLTGAFKDLHSPIKITVAKQDAFIHATKKGSLNVISENGIQGVLEDVLYCPEIPHNLLSVSKMQKAGFTITFYPEGVKISKESKTVIEEERGQGFSHDGRGGKRGGRNGGGCGRSDRRREGGERGGRGRGTEERGGGGRGRVAGRGTEERGGGGRGRVAGRGTEERGGGGRGRDAGRGTEERGGGGRGSGAGRGDGGRGARRREGQERGDGQQRQRGPGPSQQQKPVQQQIRARDQQQQQQQRSGPGGQQKQEPQKTPLQAKPRQPQDKPPTKQLEKLSIKNKSSPKPASLIKIKSDVKTSVPDGIAKALIKQIPVRNGEGKLGRRIKVFVNMMEIKFEKNFHPDVVHYDITFDPDTPRYLIRPAFQKLQEQHFLGRYPAFDGRKNVFSAGLLPFGESFVQEIEVPNENGKMKKFKITMTKVNDIDLSWLKKVKIGLSESERDLMSITALDIILRQAPYQNLQVTPVGRSFFTKPSGQVAQLGDGLELWVGLFQSAILGWKPLLNVDVAHKGFPVSQKVTDLMAELCRTNDIPSRRDVDWKRHDIEKYLKKLKVTYEIPGQKESRRIFTINGLVKSARDNVFEHGDNRITVEQYYLIAKNYKIRYFDLPCLHVGPIQKNIHVPAELCTILPGQATNKKMNETQTSSMIKHAATKPEIRKNKIMDSFKKIRHNENPCLQEFGLSIGSEFEKVNARVLNPPTLTYDRDVDVKKGTWFASKFFAPEKLPDKSWTILCLDDRTKEDSLRTLESSLRNEARGLGMQIGCALTPYPRVKIDNRNDRSSKDIIKALQTAKNNQLQLVFVVVPDRPANIYSKVKQVAELNIGILTQCIKAFTVFKKMNSSTVGNILLKVNAKLDGINHIFKQDNKRPKCLNGLCMIVGADVTHPSPDATDIPSIAAVAASHDPEAFKYNIEIRLQPPRVEIIQNLEEIMIIQLKTFIEKTNEKPDRIIFYRDGVSEGQFPQVMHYELQAIRNACSKMNANYKPPISFFVVQKRHHIRLFPADSRNSDDRNGNVQAGTIVDSEITHPSHIDFYLVSHASIQGTARPTKYRCLWDDSNMTVDEIEQLTYYLCHMFSRCTRSVSYPAPTYYAHLAAFRARALIQDVPIDVNNLEQEQRVKLTITKEFAKNPMFFV